MSEVKIQRLGGGISDPVLDALARLRIEVFRDWPYLYDGSLDYERTYLARYGRAATGTIIIARDGGETVGASTALALEEEDPFVKEPFIKAGFSLQDVFYFGESVLRSSYRGRGIGVRFFEEREAAARSFGKRWVCFCAVVRAADHPAKPADYVPLDVFWQHRGYVRRPDLISSFQWRDIGDEEETAKSMVYWMKDLGKGE